MPESDTGHWPTPFISAEIHHSTPRVPHTPFPPAVHRGSVTSGRGPDGRGETPRLGAEFDRRGHCKRQSAPRRGEDTRHQEGRSARPGAGLPPARGRDRPPPSLEGEPPPALLLARSHALFPRRLSSPEPSGRIGGVVRSP